MQPGANDVLIPMFSADCSLPSAFTLLLLHHTISTGRNVTYSLAQNPAAENFSQISVLRNDAFRFFPTHEKNRQCIHKPEYTDDFIIFNNLI